MAQGNVMRTTSKTIHILIMTFKELEFIWKNTELAFMVIKINTLQENTSFFIP